MKYRIKFAFCGLLAGLMALMNSCGNKEATVQLITSKKLDFPSASAIEFYNNKLYLLGDDASYLLVLDTGYNLVDTVQYIQSTDRRLPKSSKPDIESAFIQKDNGEPVLVSAGSMSTSKRFTNFLFYLNQKKPVDTSSFFTQGIRLPGIEELNIEGSTLVNDKIILANRANNSSRKNHLVTYSNANNATLSELLLKDGQKIIGISGLFYLKEKDMLLFTASIENTSDATVDGAIGDSYLGFINSFSKAMNAKSIVPDRLINLSTVHQSFKKQKVESVCVERWKGAELLLHLVSDNDDGRSKIFKIGLKP